ncbi:MAG: hypothetical protein ABI136_06750 [Ginsengibacter sp.]
MENNIPDEIISVSNSLEDNSTKETRNKLIDLINKLINKDFEALIQLLYRVDVNEKKIRAYLNENSNEDSAAIIADLIIERQLQKIESRKKYSSKNDNHSNEERW